MDWDEFVDYSHTWSDDVFNFVVSHLRGQPTADDLVESFSNNDPQRHRAILQAAEVAGTPLKPAELAELSDCTSGAFKDYLAKRASASASTFKEALELLDVANLDADALVSNMLARGLRPSTEEVCQLFEAENLSKSAGALVASTTGTFTFEQVIIIGDCTDEDTMGLALTKGLNEGLRLSVAQVMELADYGIPEEALSAAIAQVATVRGGLRPADVMALSESVDEITLTNMLEVTAGTFSIKQGRQLCDRLYGDDYGLMCVVDHMDCSDDRKLALLEEFGADVYELFGKSSDTSITSIRMAAAHPRRNTKKDATPLLLTGIALAGDTYLKLLDKASRKDAASYDTWGTGPENPMGFTSWDEGSEEDDDAENWT